MHAYNICCPSLHILAKSSPGDCGQMATPAPGIATGQISATDAPSSGSPRPDYKELKQGEEKARTAKHGPGHCFSQLSPCGWETSRAQPCDTETSNMNKGVQHSFSLQPKQATKRWHRLRIVVPTSISGIILVKLNKEENEYKSISLKNFTTVAYIPKGFFPL